MRIGIEGQRLFREKKHGMDMVALELVRNLQTLDGDNEYVVFVKPDVDDRVINESYNLKIVKLEGGAYPQWEQLALPRAAKRYGCQLLHCTSNTAPINTDIPLIVTLHDIIYMESSYLRILNGSGSSYQKFGNVYRKLVVPQVVKKSKRIITVSHFEKNRIGEFFGMAGDDRLTAIYNGVSEHFKPVTDKSELDRVKNKYKLPDEFFFFLGNTDPKKNTRGTLDAYSRFVSKYGNSIKLVMLDYDLEELKSILIDLNCLSILSQIVLTGYVVNTDLPAIYSLSKVFLYPSLRESFGIPMLEAMACGVPVITSNTSSMPEVAGDAAQIIDPASPGQMTAAMLELVENQELRDQLIPKGLERSGRFSWRQMAIEVKALYNEVYNEEIAQ
jgi:glycosyltransferase involved in cell wall biosynthesis